MVARFSVKALVVAIAIAAQTKYVESSHRLGSRLQVNPPSGTKIGPDSGAAPDGPNRWDFPFSDPNPITKFLLLRLRSNISGTDRVEIDVGYGTDIFTASSGLVLHSRPIGGNAVTISYYDEDADGIGSVDFIEYGRGEESKSNDCKTILFFFLSHFFPVDLFLAPANCPFVEPNPVKPELGLCPKTPPYIPSWVNTACLPAGIQKEVAKSVGEVVWLGPDKVTSCTATLISDGTVLTCAHCIPDLTWIQTSMASSRLSTLLHSPLILRSTATIPVLEDTPQRSSR